MSNAHRRNKVRRENEQLKRPVIQNQGRAAPSSPAQEPRIPPHDVKVAPIAGTATPSTGGVNGHAAPPPMSQPATEMAGTLDHPVAFVAPPTSANAAHEQQPTLPEPAPVPPGSTKHNGNSRHPAQRTPTPPGELTPLLDALRALFTHDRANGARPDAMRCGICYLTFPRDALRYHEPEGFYACVTCEAGLRHGTMKMIHKQRK